VDPVRIGVLGAAKIVPEALIKPAASIPSAECAAIAARDPDRAAAFARRHGIPIAHPSYGALLADNSLDAIYIPLPNSLHAEWTLRSLEAGKHVLCEKPFTANADEAELVAAAAEGSGRVVMEAFHWRYHPLAARMLEIVNGGELGEIRHLEGSMCFSLFRRSDIRWDPGLAGGALMDAGCYAVHWVRTLAGAEPSVRSATARLRAPGVDRFTQADLTFPDGRTGRVTASMWSRKFLDLSVTVVGDRASLRVLNPIRPAMFHRLTIQGDGRTRRERVPGGSTYGYQLSAFVEAIREGGPVLTPPSDSVATMRVIDAIYRAAGLEPRRGSVA
jgi:predicted dehydrogenase